MSYDSEDFYDDESYDDSDGSESDGSEDELEVELFEWYGNEMRYARHLMKRKRLKRKAEAARAAAGLLEDSDEEDDEDEDEDEVNSADEDSRWFDADARAIKVVHLDNLTGRAHHSEGGLKTALIASRTVQKVDLSGSKIGSAAHDAEEHLGFTTNDLAEVVMLNRSIKTLLLPGNGITDDDVLPLGRALFKKNRTLTELHLAHNLIGRMGVAFLRPCLSRNTSSLRSLKLYSNPRIGEEESLDLVAKALELNRSLTYLSLANCKISDHGMKVGRRVGCLRVW